MFKLSNSQYDAAKNVTTLWIPGAATLYASVAAIWGLGYAVEVVGTATAVVTFLGLILKINTTKFQATHTTVPDVQLALLESSEPGVTLSNIQDTLD